MQPLRDITNTKPKKEDPQLLQQYKIMPSGKRQLTTSVPYIKQQAYSQQLPKRTKKLTPSLKIQSDYCFDLNTALFKNEEELLWSIQTLYLTDSSLIQHAI